MSVLQSLKPFWPLLLTFVFPRALGYVRALRVAIRTRPQPTPLSEKAKQSLNILYGTAFGFFIGSMFKSQNPNVFVLTKSRLHIPTDVLFTRLALTRPDGILTHEDELLKEKLTTPNLRSLYLRFGPSTLANCSFCQPDDDFSYFLYHLSEAILLKHLIQFFFLGLATSATVSSYEASRWRLTAFLGALLMLLADLYITFSYTPRVDPNMPSPAGLFWIMNTMRSLSLCIYDAVIALCIYASATNRWLIFSSTSDPETARRKQIEMLNSSNLAMQMTNTKLRAVNVARNAIVRNKDLKRTEDEYWREVVEMEGAGGTQGVWEDEEVQAAIARAYGSGTLDVQRMRKEADMFVQAVTKGLEGTEPA